MGGRGVFVRNLIVRYRSAFDGSGADNFYDAGSCIDGRLTSAWNWCSQISTVSLSALSCAPVVCVGAVLSQAQTPPSYLSVSVCVRVCVCARVWLCLLTAVVGAETFLPHLQAGRILLFRWRVPEVGAHWAAPSFSHSLDSQPSTLKPEPLHVTT